MKKLSFALVGAAALALAACGGKGDDTLGDNIADNYEPLPTIWMQRPTIPPMRWKPTSLENQADALREEGENKEEAVDDADVNAQAVNAM